VSVFTFSAENFLVSCQNAFFEPSFSSYRQGTPANDLSEETGILSMEQERIQFPKGKQKEFISEAKKLSGKSWKTAGEAFCINNNTFQTYWKEKTRLSKKDFEKICQKLTLDSTWVMPRYNAKNLFLDPRRPNCGGTKNLWRAKIQSRPENITYSNENTKLDCTQVCFSKRDIEKKINLPKEITSLLAEEIGTGIGDGFISNKKYEYRLKGNKKDEKEYYEGFVKPMFKDLYNMDLAIKDYEKTVGFEAYSQALWEFKTKVIGLPEAPKRTIKIPETLKIKNKEVLCSLMRGLFDTDGTIYFRSQGRNKAYYPVITFTTISKGLAEDMIEILKMLGFNPKIFCGSKITPRCPNPRYSVIMNGYANFALYKKLINTRQPKNVYKLKAWEERYK
jgi:intein/homing endonuclease